MNARLSAVADLERRLDYVFKDRALLERALTHASAGQGAKSIADNERLEFLGDRVLGLIVAEMLIDRFPDLSEGDLSKRLHALVSREACVRVAEQIGIGPALRLAAGETKGGGRQNPTILGDACEAVIAAVYRDGGLDAARQVFGPRWEAEVAALGSLNALNPKSHLQEWAASKGKGAPAYRIVSREGPDHAPTFVVEAAVAGWEPARGEGRSRQDAEKAAAAAMLQREGQL